MREMARARVSVAALDRAEHLLHQRRSRALAVAVAVVAHTRDERAANAHLHDDEQLVVLRVLERLEHLDDVRVVERPLDLNFLPQLGDHLRLEPVEPDRLQRKLLARRLLRHRRHRAAPAAPQLPPFAQVVHVAYLVRLRAVRHEHAHHRQLVGRDVGQVAGRAVHAVAAERRRRTGAADGHLVGYGIRVQSRGRFARSRSGVARGLGVTGGSATVPEGVLEEWHQQSAFWSVELSMSASSAMAREACDPSQSSK